MKGFIKYKQTQNTPKQMITASNYSQEIMRIGIHSMPETFQTSHEFFGRATKGFTDLHRIQDEGKIKDTWKLYLEKLNNYASKKDDDFVDKHVMVVKPVPLDEP